MSKRYNQAFLSDPLGFCRAHRLIADADGGHVLKVKNTYKSVPSDGRVWFWNIKEEAESSPENRGLCKIDIASSQKKDYHPCFWLPWEAGTIIKCTLKSKVLDDDDVRVFFTAPVDGCSILIEGPRETPSVYHANAVDHTVGTDSYTQRRNRTAKIEQRWQNVPLPKRAIPKHLQSKTKYRNQFTGRALHGHHYMKNYLAPTDEPDKLLKESKIPKNKVLIRKYMGTVFGFKDANTGYWTFYYQRLFFIYYTNLTGQGVKQWFGSGAIKFWPGNGTLVLHKQSPIYNVDPELGIEMM